ncbi:MAG: hypothetical protein IPL49_18020 [Saprospirales bacterium]|nr:hypothetical protein [Saprospirales bacterium]
MITTTLSGNDGQLTQGFQQPGCLANVALTCPTDIINNTHDGVCSALINYELPAITDNCSTTTLAQTAGQPSGSSFLLGTDDHEHLRRFRCNWKDSLLLVHRYSC